jgi:hypothetical protein
MAPLISAVIGRFRITGMPGWTACTAASSAVAPIYWQDLQTALKQPPSDRSSSMTDADVLWYGIDRTWREQAIPTERPLR